MTEFFQTIMGKQFYEGTMPRLVKALEGLNKELGRIRDENKSANEEVLKQAQQARGENAEILDLLNDKVPRPGGIFQEWASCAAKPGSPLLCESCLSNRTLITELNEKLEQAIRKDARTIGKRLQELFWADGSETQHTSDTLGEAANILKEYGYGPKD